MKTILMAIPCIIAGTVLGTILGTIAFHFFGTPWNVVVSVLVSMVVTFTAFQILTRRYGSPWRY